MGQRALLHGRFVNAGTVNQVGDLLISSGQATNADVGTWNLIQGDIDILVGADPRVAFVNDGDLVKPNLPVTRTPDSVIPTSYEGRDESVIRIEDGAIAFTGGATSTAISSSEPEELPCNVPTSY